MRPATIVQLSQPQETFFFLHFLVQTFQFRALTSPGDAQKVLEFDNALLGPFHYLDPVGRHQRTFNAHSQFAYQQYRDCSTLMKIRSPLLTHVTKQKSQNRAFSPKLTSGHSTNQIIRSELVGRKSRQSQAISNIIQATMRRYAPERMEEATGDGVHEYVICNQASPKVKAKEKETTQNATTLQLRPNSILR